MNLCTVDEFVINYASGSVLSAQEMVRRKGRGEAASLNLIVTVIEFTRCQR